MESLENEVPTIQSLGRVRFTVYYYYYYIYIYLCLFKLTCLNTVYLHYCHYCPEDQKVCRWKIVVSTQNKIYRFYLRWKMQGILNLQLKRQVYLFVDVATQDNMFFFVGLILGMYFTLK